MKHRSFALCCVAAGLAFAMMFATVVPRAGAATAVVALTPAALDAPESATPVNYRGVPGVLLTAPDDVSGLMPTLKGTAFRTGSIDVDLAGDTRPDAPQNVRGFVGVAFAVDGGQQYECFYLRPKNSHSLDQEQRNHSAQYISIPGGDWPTLRAKSPGKYETYVDILPGEWTHVRIEVAPDVARLFVNRAKEPALIAQRITLGPATPRPLALWVGPGTIAHFANLSISPD